MRVENEMRIQNPLADGRSGVFCLFIEALLEFLE